MAVMITRAGKKPRKLSLVLRRRQIRKKKSEDSG